MNQVTIFNNYAKEFLYKMRDRFPEETKIQGYIIMFLGLEAIDPTQTVKMFIESVKEYGFQIMTKDEHYFKKEQYVNHAESISGKMGLIDHWESMGKDTQESIWKYLQILYITGMRALNEEEQLKELLRKVREQGF